MAVLWFLLGLTIGLALLSWQHAHFDSKLRKLVQELQSDASGVTLPATSRLTMAIAQQQRTQQELERTVETLKQVIYAAPIGYLQVDDENQLIWCNAAASQLLHIQPYDQLKPRLLLELVRSYELDHLIEQTRSAQQPCEWEWTFYPAISDPSKLSQQQMYPLRGYGLPLLDGQVGVFLENRQEAVHLTQQRDRWTSDVAHELKTPLTSIRLVAETLQSRVEPPLRDWIDRLLNETLRLSSLVQDLLDLSQLDLKSTNRLTLKVFDLVKLVHAAWSSLEPLARRRYLQLDYIGPDQLLIQADEPRLYRVLINLLDNSIKYSPTRQTIRVQIRVETESDLTSLNSDPQVHLEVIDAGPGFSSASLPYVFERFYRADPSRARSLFAEETQPTFTEIDRRTTVTESSNEDRDLSNKDATVTSSIEEDTHAPVTHRGASQLRQSHSNAVESPLNPGTQALQSSSGSGLGLAIVRQIVEVHGGMVKADNHPDTGGAWLQVFLPLQQSKQI